MLVACASACSCVCLAGVWGSGALGPVACSEAGPRRGALLRALVPVAHCCCAVFAAAPCGQPTAPPAVLRCACSPSTIQRARRPSSNPHMPPNARRRRTESALPRGAPAPPYPLLLCDSCTRPIGKMSYYWAGLSLVISGIMDQNSLPLPCKYMSKIWICLDPALSSFPSPEARVRVSLCFSGLA